uniref:NADH:ubiquinone reductase (H(+)-translocating) n=1 Tax=Parasagitta elegans TaxID=1562708 RepID=A0A141CL66_9BILA|nr:NADH dehydrogenase subunit 5 [Parasagitta elegans]
MVLMYVMVCLSMILLISSCSYSLILQHLCVFSFNVFIDIYSSSFIMLLVLISNCVMVWSYFYMDLDVAYRRFTMILLSFVGSMFVLVLFSSLCGALIGWDCLGITSFLLVIYYKNRKALGSGMITVLTNRIGDCFFLGLLVLQFSVLLDSYIFTVLLLLASMTKSAQFPFSSWLPAAMAAPTPVSALVHSSTLVTAGVYLLIRFNNMNTEWMVVLGSMTMMTAGLCACAEMDIKKIVALSTLSQLGVMMVALSMNMKSLCFFHLTTHAIFKSLLFVSVGVGIHSVYGSQDFRTFSSFSSLSKLPTLGLSAASMSLAGLPFLSGFYSKDSILESFYNTNHSFMFLLVFLASVGLTAVYSVKLISLAFVGNNSAGATDLNGGGLNWVCKLPILILCLGSVIVGLWLSNLYTTDLMLCMSSDKMLPLFAIVCGSAVGLLVTNMKSAKLSTLFYLTPLVQYNSLGVMGMHNAGELERGLLTLSTTSFFGNMMLLGWFGGRWVVAVVLLLGLAMV